MRSSRRVQQMHPLLISTSFSSVRDRVFSLWTRLASTLTSPSSLTMTATLLRALLQVVLVVQDVVQQGRLAGAEEARQDRYGEFAINHGRCSCRGRSIRT